MNMKIKQSTIDSTHKNINNESKWVIFNDIIASLGLVNIELKDSKDKFKFYKFKNNTVLIYKDDIFIGVYDISNDIKLGTIKFVSKETHKILLDYVKKEINTMFNKNIELLEIV